MKSHAESCRFGIRTKVALRTAAAAFIVAVAFAAGSAHAGNYGYNVTYNSKVEKGELELMFMNDITQPSAAGLEEGSGTYLSHMVELEYGLSDQLATEFMIEWYLDLDTSDRHFTGFRWETRYRLFGREVPLNPMVYAEYEDLDPRTRFKMEVSGWVRPPYEEEDGVEPDRERVLETRLVLSEDFGPVNFAFNWINEDNMGSGRTAFGYATGVVWMPGHGAGEMGREEAYSCPMHPDVRQSSPGVCPKCGMVLAEVDGAHAGRVGAGLELYGALGDTKSFKLEPKRQEHYLGPILMYHFTSKLMMHTQLAIGLSHASDNLVRLNFGYDF